MQTAEQVFDYLAKQYGVYGGKYVIMSQPYINNRGTDGEVVYNTRAATIESIRELQEEGLTHNDGFPDESECFELYWWPTQEWLDSGDTDESNACDWDSFDVYDGMGNFIAEVE